MPAPARARTCTRAPPPDEGLVLPAASDFFSNGIHLNVIQAAVDPGAESWRNLHAIDESCATIVADRHAPRRRRARGDAAAGGVPFALAADEVVAREDVVLNPYYRHMGGLYGSEYWTYLMPRARRRGADRASSRAPRSRRSAPAGPSRSGCSTTPTARRSRVPGADPRARAAARRRPDLGPGSRTSAAAARRRAGQAAAGLPHARSWPARTARSSAPTAATTRRAGASSASSPGLRGEAATRQPQRWRRSGSCGPPDRAVLALRPGPATAWHRSHSAGSAGLTVKAGQRSGLRHDWHRSRRRHAAKRQAHDRRVSARTQPARKRRKRGSLDADAAARLSRPLPRSAARPRPPRKPTGRPRPA